jgi:hypothetical protein
VRVGFDVASKVAPVDEPRATHVTHARVQPQTGSDSPKLKPGFASPKLESSEIGRTSLISPGPAPQSRMSKLTKMKIFDDQSVGMFLDHGSRHSFDIS